MKNKKGFTLVELIGVVILIGIITLIAVPSVDYVITNTKDKAYNRTLDTLKDGLRNWVTDNKELIYEDGEEIIVTLADLKEQGYVEYEIKNPKTSTCLANTMQFKITRVKDTEKDTYEYTFLDEELLDGSLKDCEAVSKTPSIYLLGDNPQKIEITNDSTLTYASFDPGATAKSSAGEDISSSIVKSNNVNLKVLGKDYHAKYTIIENGISKTLTRKVYVVDTTAPELHVPEDLEIGIGETLNLMEGVTATDNSGVAPTIKTSGSVNYNRPGEYIITYIATDKSGNSVSKDRVIKVIRAIHLLQTAAASEGEFRMNNDFFDMENTIVSIKFETGNKVPANAVIQWDLSEANNNSIIGYLVENEQASNYYDMHIISMGQIRANPNFSYWFSNMENLMTIEFENFDTVGTTNMSGLFNMTDSLIELDLSMFDTSSVTDMSYMFAYALSLSEINFENIDTSNVTDMSYMFTYNKSLIDVELSGFDTANVTNMRGMFNNGYYAGTGGLTNVDVSSFNTSNVVDMSEMFACQSLQTIKLGNLNTSNVTNMFCMFCGTESLVSVDVSLLETNNVTNMEKLFYGAEKLISIDLSNFDATNVTNMNQMFVDTDLLAEIRTPINIPSTISITNILDKTYYDHYNGIEYKSGSFPTGNGGNSIYLTTNPEFTFEISITEQFLNDAGLGDENIWYETDSLFSPSLSYINEDATKMTLTSTFGMNATDWVNSEYNPKKDGLGLFVIQTDHTWFGDVDEFEYKYCQHKVENISPSTIFNKKDSYNFVYDPCTWE